MKRDDIPGYVFDALDPDEQRRLEERLEKDPELARQVEAMWRIAAPLAADDCIEPPQGLAERTLLAISTAGERVQPQVARDWSTTRGAVRPLDFIVAATLFGLAATLAIPAIMRLRGDQDRIVCADHLRTMGIALAMYAEQEGGQLPYVAPEGPLNNAGVFAVLLQARDLLPDRKQLVCPSGNSAVVLVPEVKEYLSQSHDSLDLDHLRRHMAGSFGYLLGYQEGEAYRGFTTRDDDSRPVMADRPPRPDEGSYENSPNHENRGQNVLFAGGHVRWLPQPVLAHDNLVRNANGVVGAGLSPDDSVIGVSEATPYSNVEL